MKSEFGSLLGAALLVAACAYSCHSCRADDRYFDCLEKRTPAECNGVHP